MTGCPFTTDPPHRQDVSTVDERRKEETGFRLQGEKTQLFLWIQSLHDKPFRYFTVTAYFPPPLAVDSKKQQAAIADRAPKFFELNIPSMHDKNDAFVG